MVESKRLTSREAYSQVMKNLTYPNGSWEDFLTIHPDRTYAYGEDGWALVLPGGLHFIDSECAWGINKVEGDFKIENFYPHGKYQRQYLEGEIPEDLIDEVVAFSSLTRGKIEQLRSLR